MHPTASIRSSKHKKTLVENRAFITAERKEEEVRTYTFLDSSAYAQSISGRTYQTW